MTEDADLANVPEATNVPKKRTRVPVVWIIPIVAALVGVGIVVQQYLSEGPTIRLSFRAAEGIEPGKTFIKYKDVEIGKVTAVALSKDFSKIVVTAKMAKHAEGLLVEDTRFWIVKPRVTLSGVSGLGTLLSGNYIGIEPGKSRRKAARLRGARGPATCHDRPPGPGVRAAGGYPRVDGHRLADLLSPPERGTGHRIRHGGGPEVRGHQDLHGRALRQLRHIEHEILGVQRHPCVDGGRRVGRADRIGAGDPDRRDLVRDAASAEEPAAPAAANTIFRLHANRAAAMAPPLAESEIYVLYFHESVRGLSVGAPVTLLGMPIGEVTEVSLDSIRRRRACAPAWRS